MKTVKVRIINGKITLDFHDFPGGECETEELKLKAWMRRMGVETQAEEEQEKELEVGRSTEKEKAFE